MLRRAALLLVATLALAGCFGGTDEPDVVEVSISSTPDGPSVVAGERERIPLERVAALVPETLPRNPAQLCATGILLRLRFDDGLVSEYGPCTLPRSLEPLRKRLVNESMRRHGLMLQPASGFCARGDRGLVREPEHRPDLPPTLLRAGARCPQFLPNVGDARRPAQLR
jgi:hypothetical protein